MLPAIDEIAPQQTFYNNGFDIKLTTKERKPMILLSITHLFPHNELFLLPYIAVATNTRAD